MYEKIENLIDDKIIKKSLEDGKSISDITKDLSKRNSVFRNILIKDNIDIDTILKSSTTDTVDLLYFKFIQHSDKRINDLNWIIKKSKELSRYSLVDLFELVKLKDKLTKKQ